MGKHKIAGIIPLLALAVVLAAGCASVSVERKEVDESLRGAQALLQRTLGKDKDKKNNGFVAGSRNI